LEAGHYFINREYSENPPAEWMKEHIKTHKRGRDVKENETRWHKIRTY